jgi:hypothetical protein
MNIRNAVLVGLLAISPLTDALAQGTTGPDVKAGSSSESTAIKNGSGTNPHQPGATGSVVVSGSNSTVSGDRKATDLEKKGSVSGGSK